MWEAYLDDAPDAAHILRSRDTALGSGLEIIASAMTPLVAAITGEALASLVRKPAAGALGKVAGRLRRGGKGRDARRAALSGPAPDSGGTGAHGNACPFRGTSPDGGPAARSRSTADIADALVSAFTERPGAGGAAGPQMPVSPPEIP